MKTRLLSLFAFATLAVTAVVTAQASYSAPRQYYSGWNESPKHTYYYRSYYYKPTPDYTGYKHNYVVYHQDQPKYYYYYNPYKKTYWGRCPVQTHGKGEYSELAAGDRKGSLSDIPEGAFPAMGDMPSVPESTDKVAMDLPPDDLPQEGAPIKGL